MLATAAPRSPRSARLLRGLPPPPSPTYSTVRGSLGAQAGKSKTVKSLRDQDATFREACVVLTGSSARDLREATDDLADRRGGVADSDRPCCR